MVPGLGASQPPPPSGPPSYFALSILVGSTSLLTALYVSPSFYTFSASILDRLLSYVPLELQNPLNLGLITLIGLFSWPMIGEWLEGSIGESSDPSKSYNWMPKEWPASVVWMTLNPMQ
jgi:hypothetical protein